MESISVRDMSVRLRKDNNMSQAQFARSIFVSQGAIARIETGRIRKGETADTIRELYYKRYGKPEEQQTEIIQEKTPEVIEQASESVADDRLLETYRPKYAKLVEVAIARMIDDLQAKAREYDTEIDVLLDAKARVLEDIAELRKEIGIA